MEFAKNICVENVIRQINVHTHMISQKSKHASIMLKVAVLMEKIVIILITLRELKIKKCACFSHKDIVKEDLIAETSTSISPANFLIRDFVRMEDNVILNI